MSETDFPRYLMQPGAERIRSSIDARAWAWISRRPTDAILVVFAILLALYLAIYFGSGAWAMPS